MCMNALLRYDESCDGEVRLCSGDRTARRPRFGTHYRRTSQGSYRLEIRVQIKNHPRALFRGRTGSVLLFWHPVRGERGRCLSRRPNGTISSLGGTVIFNLRRLIWIVSLRTGIQLEARQRTTGVSGHNNQQWVHPLAHNLYTLRFQMWLSLLI